MERQPSSAAPDSRQAAGPGIYPGTDETRDSQSAVPENVQQQAESARDHARSAKDQAKEQGREISGRVRSGASQARNQAVEQTRRAGAAVRDQAMSLIQDQKQRLAEQIGEFTDATRKAAGKLHDEQDHNIAGYLDGAAEYLDRCRSYLADRDTRSLLSDARSLARRHPGSFLGWMFVLGVAIARFAKSESPRSSRDDGDAGRSAGSEGFEAGRDQAGWRGMGDLPPSYPPPPSSMPQTVPIGAPVAPPASAAPPADIVPAGGSTAASAVQPTDAVEPTGATPIPQTPAATDSRAADGRGKEVR
jgi:hypothetical protein